MRIVVIGGSNSILKNGYLAQLHARLPEVQVVNRSVGAASSMMGYFRLVGCADLAADDIVLWDYALNDQNQIRDDAANSTERVLRYVELTLRLAQDRGARFLPLVLRPHSHADSSRFSLYRTGLMELFSRYGVTPLDAHAEHAERHGGADVPASAYRDGSHYDPEGDMPELLAKVAARRIAEGAVSLPQRLDWPVFDQAPGQVQVLTWFAGMQAVTFRNSLIHETVWRPMVPPVEVFRPRLGRWRLAAGVVLTNAPPSHLLLRAGGREALLPCFHRPLDLERRLLRMVIFQPAQMLVVGPNAPLVLAGAGLGARAQDLQGQAILPPDCGLVGLILEPVAPRA